MQAKKVLEQHLKSIGLDPKTIVVPKFVAVPEAEFDRCFNNCLQYSRKYPIWEVVLGWSVTQFGHTEKCIAFNFTFHAVIKKGENAFVDVTPDRSGVTNFLFIPDPVITSKMYYTLRGIEGCERIMPSLRSYTSCSECRKHAIDHSAAAFAGNEIPRELVLEMLKCVHVVDDSDPEKILVAANEDAIRSIVELNNMKPANWFEMN